MSATEALPLVLDGIKQIQAELAEVREFRATATVDAEKRVELENTITDLGERLKKFEDKAGELDTGFFAHGAKVYNPQTGKGFSISRATKAQASGDWSNAQEEKDILTQCKLFSHQKAQGSQVDATGGFSIPENLVPGLIEKLQANTVFNAQNIGCFEMPAVPGTMQFNRIASTYTAAAQATEGAALTESTMQLEQIELMPKTLAVYCRASNLLLANNTAGADAWITMQMARDAAIAHDSWVLRGTGATGQPLGLLNDPDIGTSSVSSTVTFNEVEAIRLAVANANGIMGNKMAWAGHPSMLSQIRFAVTSSGPDMVRMSRSESPNAPLIGYPVFESTNFSATTDANSLVFGAWDMLIIANFSGYIVTKSDQKYFDTNETAFRLIKYMDTHRLQPGAFCKAT